MPASAGKRIGRGRAAFTAAGPAVMVRATSPRAVAAGDTFEDLSMKAEIQSVVDEIQQALSLLRRHL